MKRIIAMMMSIALGFIFCINAKAEVKDPYKVFITCYVITGTTASGEQTREGIVAMNDALLGKTIILYTRKDDGSIGDVYGIYEVKDTGGTKGLKNGSVVDIWMPSLEDAKETMRETKGLGYVQILDSEG